MKKIGISLIALMIIIVGFLSGCVSEQEEDQSNGTQDKIKLEGKIAYVSDVNIHIINPDGTNEISLTEGAFPVWSPDGNKISYRIYSSGGYYGGPEGFEYDDEDGRYIINADGTGKTRIAEFTTGSIWLPDGERILLIKYAAEETSIYIANADGSNLVMIAEIEGTVLSVDEKKIIYENPEEDTIYIMDIDGTNISTLIEDTNVYQLTRSPDGKKIAYATLDKGGTIYGMDADGKNKIMLATSVFAPVWSPDSKKIAYLLNKQDFVASLCLMNPDGTGKKEIAEGWIDYDSGQSWSPDSKKIAFTMDDPSNIYIVNVDGTGLTQLAIGYYPQWSPS